MVSSLTHTLLLVQGAGPGASVEQPQDQQSLAQAASEARSIATPEPEEGQSPNQSAMLNNKRVRKSTAGRYDELGYIQLLIEGELPRLLKLNHSVECRVH